METLAPLAQYGVVGVCIALIALIAFLVKVFFDSSRSWQDHAKECQIRVASALDKNSESNIELSKKLGEFGQIIQNKL